MRRLSSLVTNLGLLLCASLLPACEKVDFGADGGITEKTAQNTPNGHTDPSDWTVDAHWNKQEQNLFQDLQLDVNGPVSTRIKDPVFVFYPNPVIVYGNLGFDFSLQPQQVVGPHIRFVVVDRKYKVLQQGNMSSFISQRLTGLEEFSLAFTDKAFKKGQTYRLYYVLYHVGFSNDKAFLCKGHGDIKIAR